jgi:hypothetical protein
LKSSSGIDKTRQWVRTSCNDAGAKHDTSISFSGNCSKMCFKVHQKCLFVYLLFYITLKNFSLIWRRHHCRRKAVKLRPMLGARGLWAGRVLLYRVPCCDKGPQFFRSPPLTTHRGMWWTYSDPDPHGSPFSRLLRHTRGYWRTYSTLNPHGFQKYSNNIYNIYNNFIFNFSPESKKISNRWKILNYHIPRSEPASTCTLSLQLFR